MRIALLADFPVHTLPGFKDIQSGHHATWLPPLAEKLKSHANEFEFHWIICTKAVNTATTLNLGNQSFHLLPRKKLAAEMLTAFWRERRLISNLLNNLAPDLVHGWGTEQGYALAALDYTDKSLISMQGILQVLCKAAPMPWLTCLQARHETVVLRGAHHLTVESPWGRSHLQRLAPTATIDLLEYGADPACFPVQRNPEKRPLALFVGSLTRLKGIDTLLDAFTDPRLKKIDLVILGALTPKLSRLNLPSNIHLLGHRPPAEVRDWMAKAWCLVHPTRADTSPNSVKEARVIGLPVITTPNGGQTQYVSHGESGFIHEAGDNEGLIQGILAITQSVEISLRMGTHGQAGCRAALAPATTAARLLEIYRNM